MSRKAISQAWAQERELVRITGKGSRDWTDSEKKQFSIRAVRTMIINP